MVCRPERVPSSQMIAGLGCGLEPPTAASAVETQAEFRGGKGNLYEGGLRIPYLVRWPGKIKAGQVSELIFYQPDVLPTLAELCKGKAPDDVDGGADRAEAVEPDARRVLGGRGVDRAAAEVVGARGLRGAPEGRRLGGDADDRRGAEEAACGRGVEVTLRVEYEVVKPDGGVAFVRGGGLAFPAAAHVCYCTAEASFGLPEVRAQRTDARRAAHDTRLAAAPADGAASGQGRRGCR